MDLQGRFITIEGGEGTGKSTLIAGLTQAFRERGIAVLTTREPGGTPLAEQVRELALSKHENEGWSPLAHALLMNAARQDHLDRQIRPALRAGRWVISDRFADSTRVYQGIDGVSERFLKALEAQIVGETRPDITLILDGDPERLQERRSLRGVSDVFEARDLGFHNAVRDGFLAIAEAEPERCAVIDALVSPEAVVASGLQAIDTRIGLP
ncbi:dTMP kinase [Hyphomonas sp. FCG-A18]|uniref:dTMP kinase n=1 Tax=Hyphomonas sp. FCG-A18 TaxID=3080019 RepID=UPI002B292DF3|nr:dTMP kinase [Hyphomonas sp. FCG-A18]